jgi:spore coat polysaccharide biosynthesis protein SpsF
MGSTRLPGKVLMKLGNKTILEHITHFVSLSQNIDQVVIATTNRSEDNQIENLANHIGIKCFRGSSDNVLERFYYCAKSFDADIVVRLTGDNPIVDPILVEKLVNISKNEEVDYVSNVLVNSYPYGYSPCEVFTFKILEKLFEENKGPKDLEHVTFHIRQNKNQYNVRTVIAPDGYERPYWRLTIDYEEDLLLLKKIFAEFYLSRRIMSYEKLVKFLDKKPELLKINSNCK